MPYWLCKCGRMMAYDGTCPHCVIRDSECARQRKEIASIIIGFMLTVGLLAFSIWMTGRR